jgi:hypothetical protein
MELWRDRLVRSLSVFRIAHQLLNQLLAIPRHPLKQ